jgi:triphosphoribosyl-dephospho-CoA synthetase
MAMALIGYKELFEDWLPYYRSTSSPVKVLLRIMSTLDDTCVVKRVGEERAARVKEEAKAALKEIPGQVRDEVTILRLCEQYAREGISPGGAADMLALTIFIDSIL